MRRWEELRGELDARQVQIVTVCTDTPEQIRKGRGKHGLRARMLADPELRVIDRLGFRNQNTQVKPPGVPGLPVPTTLLLDAQGRVVWLDQAENYQRRSDPDRIRLALQTHLDRAASGATS